jgi:antitoxin MazE
MNTTIKKWGNSLALRIPKSYAREINLEEGAWVDLKLEENKIIVSPMKKRKKKYTLEGLVSKINSKNRHGEISVGPRVGKELI